MNASKLTAFLLLTCSLFYLPETDASQFFTDNSGKFIQADSLTWVGKASNTKNIYHRVDTAIYNKMPLKVKSLFTNSAGIAIAFTTNSTSIAAKWSVRTAKDFPICPMSIRWD